MRILHINCNYVATTLHQLMIEELDALGIENEVFVPIHAEADIVIQPNNDVFVAKCFDKWNRYLFDLKQAKIIRCVEKHYNVADFDLIHAYTVFTDGNCARVLSKKYNVPYVVAVRNTDVNTFFKKRVLLRNRGRKILQEASRVFFLSNAYQKEVIGTYVHKIKQQEIIKKSCVIPNGIDDFWFDHSFSQKRIIDKNNVKLIYAGGIDKNKNITATLSAMEILRSNGIETTLTVVGKIVDRTIGEIIINNPHATYIEKQPKETLIDLYRKSDIFVMPSFHESFGLVYAEALSQGLPVIYSKGQGFDEQFENGYIGYAVDPKDPQSIADGILNAIHLYEPISDRCSKCVDRFNWDRITQKYQAVYETIIDK